jgi:hypothetical protein
MELEHIIVIVIIIVVFGLIYRDTYKGNEYLTTNIKGVDPLILYNKNSAPIIDKNINVVDPLTLINKTKASNINTTQFKYIDPNI